MSSISKRKLIYTRAKADPILAAVMADQAGQATTDDEDRRVHGRDWGTGRRARDLRTPRRGAASTAAARGAQKRSPRRAGAWGFVSSLKGPSGPFCFSGVR